MYNEVKGFIPQIRGDGLMYIIIALVLLVFCWFLFTILYFMHCAIRNIAVSNKASKINNIIGNNPNNENLKWYIAEIKKLNLINDGVLINRFHAIYKLISEDEKIDGCLKTELRRILLGKGVNVY